MLANLLAWRQRRLKARLRFWTLIAGGIIAIMLMVFLARESVNRVEAGRQKALLNYWQGIVRSAEELSERAKKLNEVLLQRQAHDARQQRHRDVIRHIGKTLRVLALALPQQVWLTAITQQKGEMIVEGVSQSVIALYALEKRDALPELTLIRQGTMQRQDNGEWRFSLVFAVGDQHVAER